MGRHRLVVATLFALCAPLGGCERHAVDVKTSTAIGDLRTLLGALETYREACGGYPAGLETPGATASATGCASRGILGPTDRYGPARPKDDGAAYVWRYVPSRAIPGSTPQVYGRFMLTCTWPEAEKRYSFWSSEVGVIRVARGRAATATDDVLQ